MINRAVLHIAHAAKITRAHSRTKYLTEMHNQNRTESLLRVFAGMFLAAAFVMLPATVRADSTATYQISGTLASGGTYAGRLNWITAPARV
jgi:hypothetical protein